MREFDLSSDKAAEVVDIVGNMTRYLARRKPELLSATTFSTYNYRECVCCVTVSFVPKLGIDGAQSGDCPVSVASTQ